MDDVVGFGSLNVDYIYETEDLAFLEPFYPEGKKRREWVLTEPAEIQGRSGGHPGKNPADLPDRGRERRQHGFFFGENGVPERHGGQGRAR